jgi:hypothetical protein
MASARMSPKAGTNWGHTGTKTGAMPSAKEILAELRKKGRENTRAIYGRHGNAAERCFGASTADMKAIAKRVEKAGAAGGKKGERPGNPKGDS